MRRRARGRFPALPARIYNSALFSAPRDRPEALSLSPSRWIPREWQMKSMAADTYQGFAKPCTQKVRAGRAPRLLGAVLSCIALTPICLSPIPGKHQTRFSVNWGQKSLQWAAAHIHSPHSPSLLSGFGVFVYCIFSRRKPTQTSLLNCFHLWFCMPLCSVLRNTLSKTSKAVCHILLDHFKQGCGTCQGPAWRSLGGHLYL